MDEPRTIRPCSTQHSAPTAWLRGDAPAAAPDQPDPEALRAAIELVLVNPEAVAEILTRARTIGVRHDGWTGERMAAFLETLADTGLVTEACRAAGMSRDSAYALRHRDPVFAAAIRAALAKAGPRVEDGLLERSLTGTVEHYYRDGVLVGERRHYESWLGLAVLKRLDKQVAEDRAEGGLAARIAGDWRAALDALREGGTAAVAGALDPEPDKADTPPPPGVADDDFCWKAGSFGDPKPRRADPQPDGAWLTTFPPPPGFAGYESCEWDGFNWYERSCTAEEAELLETHQAAAAAEEQAELTAEAEAERDAWFARLRKELVAMRAPGLEPEPAA